MANSQTGSEWQMPQADAFPASEKEEAVQAAASEKEEVKKAVGEPEPEQGAVVRLHSDSQYLLESMDKHLRNIEKSNSLWN